MSALLNYFCQIYENVDIMFIEIGIKMYGQILYINDHIKYENYEFIS
jgi:hypothetical protein